MLRPGANRDAVEGIWGALRVFDDAATGANTALLAPITGGKIALAPVVTVGVYRMLDDAMTGGESVLLTATAGA